MQQRWTPGEMVFAAVLYTGGLWGLAWVYNWIAAYFGMTQRTSLTAMLFIPLAASLGLALMFLLARLVARILRPLLPASLYKGWDDRPGPPTDPR